MIHLLGKFSTNSDLDPIPKEKMIDENSVQVENGHRLQEENVINEQISKMDDLETHYETAKHSHKEPDLVSQQSLELEMEPNHKEEVIIFLRHFRLFFSNFNSIELFW